MELDKDKDEKIIVNSKVSRKNRRKSIRRNVLERSLYYVDINGYSSNRDSLQHIIEEINPDIIIMCETKVGKKNKWNMENHQMISKHCFLGTGGLVMAAKCGTFSSFIEVTETDNEEL